MIKQNILIHNEMAAFSDDYLLEILFKQIIPHSNSIGLNEEELLLLLQFLKKEKRTDYQDTPVNK